MFLFVYFFIRKVYILLMLLFFCGENHKGENKMEQNEKVAEELAYFTERLTQIYKDAGSKASIEQQCLRDIFVGDDCQHPTERHKEKVYGAIGSTGLDLITVLEDRGIGQYTCRGLFSTCLTGSVLIDVVHKHLKEKNN